MVADFPSQQDQARVEDQRHVQNYIRQDRGSLSQNSFRMGIAGRSKIENLGGTTHSRTCPISLDAAAPTLEDAGRTQNFLESSIGVNGGLFPRYVGNSQVSNLAGRPLRAMIDLAIQKDAGAYAVTDGYENEILLLLCCATIVLALSRKIGVVFDNYRAFQLVLEHTAQRHVAPIP